MGVKIKTTKDDTNNLEKTSKELQGKAVKVGVYGEHAWLAGIHEFGCNITPKNAKYLTIPCNKKSVGKRAGDFQDLFFVESKTGEKFLAQNRKNNGTNQIELLFWLTESVHIPERSFLRSGFDDCNNEILKISEKAISDVFRGSMSVDDFLSMIGLQLSTKIKTYAVNLKTPKNQAITEENKKSTNPLVDTGDMINSITYKVE